MKLKLEASDELTGVGLVCLAIVLVAGIIAAAVFLDRVVLRSATQNNTTTEISNETTELPDDSE